MAARDNPVVAEGMNRMPKIVFSRTMERADWSNTSLIKGDIVGEMRSLKAGSGVDMVIMGSGSVVAQLSQERLIDEYQIVVVPIVLGAGRTMFESLSGRMELTLTSTRSFDNGNVLLCYAPKA